MNNILENKLRRLIRQEIKKSKYTRPEKVGKYTVGDVVNYIVPGTNDVQARGKISDLKSSRDEDFAVINGKNVPYRNIG